MNRKRDIKTCQIKRWKDRLNADRSIMKKGINYDRVYSTVAVWTSIRIILILLELEGWNTMQLDYFQDFPHSTIDKDLYLKVPSGF